MKKKNTTPEKAVKRLKIIIAAVFAMIAFVIIVRIGRGTHYNATPTEVEAAMDIQLDSLMKTSYPEGAVILKKGPYEKLTDERQDDSKYRNSIRKYELASVAENQNEQEIDKLKKEAQKAKDKLEKGNKQSAYYRNIIVQQPDGKKKSFYQKTSESLDVSEIIMSITITETEELENKINE